MNRDLRDFHISPATKLLDTISYLKLKDNCFKKVDVKSLIHQYGSTDDVKKYLDIYNKMLTSKVVAPMHFGSMVDTLSKVLYMQYLALNGINDTSFLDTIDSGLFGDKRCYISRLLSRHMRVPVKIFNNKYCRNQYMRHMNVLVDCLLNDNSTIKDIWIACHFLTILDNQFKSGFCKTMNLLYRYIDESYDYINNIINLFPDALILIESLSINTFDYLQSKNDIFICNRWIDSKACLSSKRHLVVGEVDFMSKSEIIDLKVSKNNPTSAQLQQTAIYHLINNNNKHIENLSIYNPLLNVSVSVSPFDILSINELDDVVDKIINALSSIYSFQPPL